MLHLDDSAPHAFWDHAHPPRLHIEPGDTVTFECRDASDGQITADSTVADFDHVDGSRIHALTGPVSVTGASPGDVLEIEIVDLRHYGWGWSGHKPGFGLLADDFRSPFLMHWDVADEGCRFRGDDRVLVPYEPFCGVMGVAPAEPGRLSTLPPRFNGGNVDIRGLTIGATALMPVLLPGALFSCGDCHAAQGDGEVSGMGIESPMTVTLKFGVRRDLSIRELQFTTPSPLTAADTRGYHCTTAHGPDLYANAQNAVRYMLDWLESNTGLTRSEAYVLCSVAGDLKISEIVDVPNWVVSFYLPLSVVRR